MLNQDPNQVPQGNTESTIKKGVRIDLSSMEVNTDRSSAVEIIDRLSSHGVNLIFLSPWNDGLAAYNSRMIARNKYGENAFFEQLVSRAHEKKIEVYAWFVVGKDNFDARKHPEWSAITVNGLRYAVEDEPGVFLSMASLANDDYVNHHLALVREVIESTAVDGWVISEPMIGWSGWGDADYVDFSEAVGEKFAVDSHNIRKWDGEQKNQWIEFRGRTVLNFVSQTVKLINELDADLRTVITVFAEPDSRGKIDWLEPKKNWGMDIAGLVALNPDYIELQAAFQDFPHPQEPKWSSELVNQYLERFPESPPVMVSVEAYPGGNPVKEVKAADFQTALDEVIKHPRVSGVNFYAYHLLDAQKWQVVKSTYDF
jgi:uncharacterized lipoprotein YddW (UPF0748 family)